MAKAHARAFRSEPAWIMAPAAGRLRIPPYMSVIEAQIINIATACHMIIGMYNDPTGLSGVEAPGQL